jgi:hypothetical protein
MNLIKITHTDIWHGNPRFIAVAFEKDAFDVARQDADAIKDVQDQNGHVVFEYVTVNELESEERFGSTAEDDFKEKLFGELPDGWKKIEEYGSLYFIKDDYIYQLALPATELVLAKECNAENSDLVQCDESAFSPDEEFDFIVNIMVHFDLEAEEVLTLVPIKNFSEETLQQFTNEYV